MPEMSMRARYERAAPPIQDEARRVARRLLRERQRQYLAWESGLPAVAPPVRPGSTPTFAVTGIVQVDSRGRVVRTWSPD